jgi:hypothetical protein
MIVVADEPTEKYTFFCEIPSDCADTNIILAFCFVILDFTHKLHAFDNYFGI